MTSIETGQEYVRDGTTFDLIELNDETVTLRRVVRYRKFGLGPVYDHVDLDRSAFEAEIAAGDAILRPECPGCGHTFDPDDPEAFVDDLCRQCWWADAPVAERVRWLVDEPGKHNMVAPEAARADDPEAFLLEYIGDPAKSYLDRVDAEEILSGAVSTKVKSEAEVRCPDCLEGVAFDMDPSTGAVTCMNCGRLMKEGEA